MLVLGACFLLLAACSCFWFPFSLERLDLIKGMGSKGDTSIRSKKKRGRDSAVKEDRHGHLACNFITQLED